jgi:hypothetical protein
MVNQRFIEKIYKFHNFGIEVVCIPTNYYSDDGEIYVIFFDGIDIHHYGGEYYESIMNLITLSECVYKHTIDDDRSKTYPYPHKSNKIKFSGYLREVICRVYGHFVEEMNVSKDEFSYVWDLFVTDINKVIKEKSIKLIFEDRYCKPLDINLLLFPKYNKIWDRLTNDIISPKKYDGRSRKVSITSTVRSKDYTLFNQHHDIKFIELTF